MGDVDHQLDRHLGELLNQALQATGGESRSDYGGNGRACGGARGTVNQGQLPDECARTDDRYVHLGSTTNVACVYRHIALQQQQHIAGVTRIASTEQGCASGDLHDPHEGDDAVGFLRGQREMGTRLAQELCGFECEFRDFDDGPGGCCGGRFSGGVHARLSIRE